MGRHKNLEARDKILQAAHSLFYENGYKGVSMEDVAQAAEVKKANLFHYYVTKQELGLAVLDCAAEKMRVCIAEKFAQKTENPTAVILRMFQDAEKNLQENRCCGGCLFGNLAQEMSDGNASFQQKISDYFIFWAEQLENFLARAKKNGFFVKELNSQQTAQALIALLEGSLLLSKAHKQSASFAGAQGLVREYLQRYQR